MKVTMLMALTADGKIGRDDAHFPDWTGKADKKLFKDITQKAGVIVMGAKTYNTIGRPLPNRKNVVMTRKRAGKPGKENLVFTDKSPKAILSGLEAEGYDHVILIGGATINRLFALEGLIDEMILTYSPKIFGRGISLFSDKVSMKLKLLALKSMDENMIYAHYKVL